LWHQIALFLRFASPRQQREAVEARVDRHDHAKRRVHVLQFLARDPQTHVIHARAAVLLRYADTEQPELGHSAKHTLPIEAMLPIVFPDVRRDLACGPFTNRLFKQLLFFCQVEADHMSPESYHALARSSTIAPRPSPRTAAALPPLTAISR